MSRGTFQETGTRLAACLGQPRSPNARTLWEKIVIENSFLTANLALAYSAYALGTASPGPGNLSVMATAMYQGRRPAMIFALGVVAGSTLWGLLAAFGLSAVMAQYSQALVVLKILGGLYLIWLAFKSAKSAFNLTTLSVQTQAGQPDSAKKLFLRGAAMHLTNPKAIFVWLSIVALALPVSAHRSDALLVVAGCVPIGIAVFCGYAIVFSTARARSIYIRTRRYFDGALATVFAYAGVRLLTSRAS